MMKKEQKYDYDAIVVGSGMSGGHAAMEFTKKGYKTLVLDRGKAIEHRKYETEFKAPWELPFRDEISHHDRVRQPIQSRKKNVFKQSTKHHFIDDIDYPYDQEKPFMWIRSSKVGGKSLLWARQSYRFNPWDFTANTEDGYGIPWPIEYKDIEPWYNYVEPFVGVAGMKEDIPQLPDSKFQPPMGLNAVEEFARENLLNKGAPGLPLARLTQGRVAHLTAPTKEHTDIGRGMCQRRNQCQRGCSWAGFYSSVGGSLVVAKNTGNITLQSDAYVLEILYDTESGKSNGVRYINTITMEEIVVTAKVIFMCASTLATLQILMNSTSKSWPNGIGNSSGVLGHYVMDHIGGGLARGTKRGGLKDAYYIGGSIGGSYVPRATNLTKEDSKDTNYVRGFGFQGGGNRGKTRRTGIGKAYKEGGRDYSDTWSIGLAGFGEMVPVKENRVTLHKTKKDKFGLPLLVTDVKYTENCLNMVNAMGPIGERILKAAGMDKVTSKTYKGGGTPGAKIHEMGGAPMGNDPKTSYLNKWNQSHEVANLFVTDGASFNSQSCVNPSLTFMAMTARAVDYADKQLKAGKL